MDLLALLVAVAALVAGLGLGMFLGGRPAAQMRSERDAREAEFKAGLDTALAYAHETGVKRLHMMAGHADANDPKAQAAYRASLALAADTLGEHGIDLLLEPINGKDMPGYFLNDFDQAAA